VGGETDTPGPEGETDDVSVRLPVNPFRLDRVTMLLFAVPAWRLRLLAAEIPKSNELRVITVAWLTTPEVADIVIK
jgi:hypothetical protein